MSTSCLSPFELRRLVHRSVCGHTPLDSLYESGHADSDRAAFTFRIGNFMIHADSEERKAQR